MTTTTTPTFTPASDVRPGQQVLTNDVWLTVRASRPSASNLTEPEMGERVHLSFEEGGSLTPPVDLPLIVRDAREVFPLSDAIGWMVASASLPGAFRHVTFSGSQMRCTCPAGVRMQDTRLPCRHARLVAAYESKASPPRPSMPAAPASMFVD